MGDSERRLERGDVGGGVRGEGGVIKQIKVSARRRKECEELNDDRNVLQKVNVSLDVGCWRASSTNKCESETSCSEMAFGFISNGGG